MPLNIENIEKKIPQLFNTGKNMPKTINTIDIKEEINIQYLTAITI